MKGWKTWASAVLSVAYGIGGMVVGIHDVDVMMGFVTAGLAVVGIGHKVEKAGKS